MAKQYTVAIVCGSLHPRNTRNVSDVFSEALSDSVYSVDEVKAGVTAECQWIGFGSGIYFGRHYQSVLQLVDSWPACPCRVFIFPTAGLPFFFWFQHRALRKRLMRRGFEVVGEFCCRGWDTVGPLLFMGGINRKHPNIRDFDYARSFATKLKIDRSAV